VVEPNIQASKSFLVDDRAAVESSGGGFAAVLNSGTGPTDVGNDSKTGAIVSVGPVNILHRAVVTGSVLSASTVLVDSDATVTGTITANGMVSLPALPTLPVFPPPTLGALTVNSGTTKSPAPGSYTQAMVNGGTLILSAGDYFFQSLTINSGSIVRATATTSIFVKNNLVFNAPILGPAGPAVEPIFLGFAGANLSLNATFDGTLVAPAANVNFGTGSGLTFTGAFFGQTLQVMPGSVLVCAVE
jgi:hypothetical protein